MLSPFLQLPATECIASNELAVAIPAPLPLSPGHTLVVTRRPIASYFDASSDEKAALWTLLDAAKTALDERLHPDGYEVGVTAGEVAGHTVPHAHIFVIPRYRGPGADAPQVLDTLRSRSYST